MRAIISSTYSDTYLFFLPLVTWCWNKLGVDVICFLPFQNTPDDVANKKDLLKTELIENTIKWFNGNIKMPYFFAPDHKQSTYAQCSRLYAACLDLYEDEILITSDVDLMPFKIPPHSYNGFTVWGADLVPNEQLPMCFVSATVKEWRNNFTKGRTYQQCLDDLVGVIECEHFRGNQWCLDQSELYRVISKTDSVRNLIPRARHGTQFADHRVDRDDVNWRAYLNENLIDAHLWRNGYEENNFNNIMELMTTIYPNEDFTWLINFKNEYLKLL